MKTSSHVYASVLVISTGFVLLYLLFGHRGWLYSAVAMSVMSLLSFRIATHINTVWLSIGNVLGFINSRLILTLVYWAVVLPVACFYRLSKQKTLELTDQETSQWVDRQHRYSKEDLKNLW